jgi:endonuclease G
MNGSVPRVPNLRELAPRALCCDAFAVLHTGTSKTPVFVAEGLDRAHLDDVTGEKRTNLRYDRTRV